MTDFQKSQARSMYQRGLSVEAIAELVGAPSERVENHLIETGLHRGLRELPGRPVHITGQVEVQRDEHGEWNRGGAVTEDAGRLAAENRALRPALEALIEAAAEAAPILLEDASCAELLGRLNAALTGARAALKPEEAGHDA